MRDDGERLQDIREAIESIEKYAARGRKAFETDELIQTWMVHHLQILGEAASRLGDEVKEKHPDVPWKKITGMRNVLVHGYFDIDPDIVWTAVTTDVPELKAALEQIADV